MAIDVEADPSSSARGTSKSGPLAGHGGGPRFRDRGASEIGVNSWSSGAHGERVSMHERARAQSCSGKPTALAARLAGTSLLLLAIAIAVTSTPAEAAPSRAEVLFAEARQLAKRGASDEACEKFAQSHALDPSVGALLNLADCAERRAELSRAWETWLDAAARATHLGQLDRASLARSRALALTPRLGTLTISVPPEARAEGLEIARDGQVLGPERWGTEHAVDPGDHAITASAPGHERSTFLVTSAAGVNVHVRVPRLVPSGSAAVTPASSAPRAEGGALDEAYAALIVAGALAALGLVWRLRRHGGPPWAARLASVRARLTLIAALVGLTGAIVSLGWLGARTQPSAPAEAQRSAGLPPAIGAVLRVAGDPWSGYSTFRRGSRLGAELARAGLVLEYLDDPTLYDQNERMRALADGRLDLALTTVDAFLQHAAKHRVGGQYPGAVVWNIDESNGGDAIFLAKGRMGFDAVEPTDRVCFAAGTPSEHLWDFASLSFAKLDAPLVQDPALVASECWKKLESGSVQIAVLWQPSTAIAARAGYPKVFSTGGQADDVIVDVVVASRRLLRERPDDVQRLARAYFETVAWYLQHPDEHARFILEDCGADCAGDIELGRAVLDGIDFLTLEHNACTWWGLCGAPPKLPDRVTKTGQLLAAKGKILTEELPRPETVLDARFLQALERERGAPPPRAVGPTTAVLSLSPKSLDKQYEYDARAPGASREGDVGTLRLPSVYFPEGVADLDANAASVVEHIAERLRAFPALCVRIQGHTNSLGNAALNQRSSEARARAIAARLTALDPDAFPPSRFDVRGLGATTPIVRKDQEDLSASRRTEFQLFRCDRRR